MTACQAVFYLIILARRENGKVFGLIERWGLTKSFFFAIVVLTYHSECCGLNNEKSPACGRVERFK
ncbi:MAG: hypothetical protein A2848_00210 [Candidatus Magasanikbacteria bacterium RIFCSPHIGHO2_01_FULL_50_8]|uniref:Uncharacterized protein n=2 Tax=Candidatus Magasanikiibacteriota TaxID=1752731 RepID=A0A1F6LN15_9BACT|nr:MAG: hypothetical protein A2848_00210 [Candidatus Magasanikbacteria bacterium RIFCSPHIGHO2_01_FULL_50_8]OGH68117.1 MAG: hypothetical protein A3C15_03335 [Candidatus Magasanikbacteria bacterium RIFCSPHIGHO2_02_FULL_50_9b]